MNFIHKITKAALVTHVIATSLPAAADRGYTWANQATVESYTAIENYTNVDGNSGWSGTAKIDRLAVGSYRVTFPHLTTYAPNYGNVLVSAYGRSNARCQVEGWSSAPAFTSYVRCFDRLGNAKDSQFTVHAAAPRAGEQTYAYAWVNDATAARSVPQQGYAFNPAGQGVVVARESKGFYQIYFKGLASQMLNASNAQVTPYGSVYATCNVVSFGKNGADGIVRVSCRDKGSNPFDTQLTVFLQLKDSGNMAFAMKNTLNIENEIPDARVNLRAQKIQRASKGIYTVEFGALNTYGAVPINTGLNISTFDSHTGMCHIDYWDVLDGGKLVAHVRCIDHLDQPLDSRFLLYVTYAMIIG